MASPMYIVNAETRKADINLMSEIGDGGISGQAFADYVSHLNGSGDFDEIDVLINSPGGSVHDGLSMFWSIQNSKIPVNTIVVGNAASMAGIVALAGAKVSIVEHGKIMIHAPHFIEDFEPTEDDIKGLNAATDQLVTILSKRMVKTEFQIRKMFDSGDQWYSAKEAKAAGLVDAIIPSQKKMAAATFTQLVAMLQEPEEITPNPIIIKPMKDLAKELDLNPEAKEEAFVKAVIELKEKASKAEGELAEVKNDLTKANETIEAQLKTITSFEDAAKQFENEQVAKTVEAAAKAGKIKDSEKASIVAKFNGNLSGLQAVIEAIPSAPQSIIDRLNRDGGSTLLSEEESKMSYKELDKSRKLKAAFAKDPDTIKAKYKEQYGSEMPENFIR